MPHKYENRRTFSLSPSEGLEVRYYVTKDSIEHEPHVFPPHVHDFLELYVLLEGDVSFMVEDKIFSLRPGDVVLSKPNELHHCVLNSKSVHRHACLWIDSTSKTLAAPFLAVPSGVGNLIRPTEEDAAALLAALLRLDEENGELDSLEHLHLLCEMLCLVRRNIQAQVVEEDTHPPLLQCILHDIAEHYREITDLDYFTEQYFISRSTLNRLFRQHLGTTPHMYLETKRLAYSRELLKQGKSVTEACMESGFCDCSHFIRLFRNRFEITPLQYKNSNA